MFTAKRAASSLMPRTNSLIASSPPGTSERRILAKSFRFSSRPYMCEVFP